MISGQQAFFFLATWWAGYFFYLLNALQNIFSSSFLCRILFLKNVCHVFTFTECIYIYIVVIVVIVQYGAAKP